MPAASPRRRTARGLSLEYKLPLLISALLLVILVAASLATYREVRRSAVMAAAERLHRVARQLAELSDPSASPRRQQMERVAANRAVKTLLQTPARQSPTGPASEAALTALQALHTAAESIVVTTIWTRDGASVASVGAGLSARDSAAARTLMLPAGPADSLLNGAFYAHGDSIFFWTATPVRDGARVLGYVAQRRRLGVPTRGREQIRQLIGRDVAVRFANTSGDLWADLAGAPVRAPVDVRAVDTVFRFRRAGEAHLAARAGVRQTPWLIILEQSYATILERPRAVLRRIVFVVAALIGIGAIAAWAVSRHVTAPLAALTAAAESIAQGDYSRRAAIARSDELGRVGETFDAMAERVEQARRRAERLQAVTAALSGAAAPDDVARVIVEQGVLAVDAQAGSLAVLGDDGTTLELVRSAGYDADVASRWRAIPLDAPLPLAEAVRTGTAIFLESEEAWRARYGDAPQRSLPESRSWAALPLVVHGRAIGALALSFTEFRAFADDERAFVNSLARQCAQALDRARIYEAERRARTQAGAALRVAESANRAKSDFLAVMSHELRTPLNAIGGYAELLEMGLRGPVTAQQAEDLARIKRSQQRLLALINDVLHFAKLDAGHVGYDITAVPVEDALAEVEVLIAPQVRMKGLTYTHRPGDPSVAVLADRERVQQIVLNLASNAIKFTEPGGRIDVEYDVAEDVVALRVRDSGIGIPPDRLEHVFDPFVQVDRRLTRVHEGIGLGLAISRDLARGMGGDLTAESVVGRGSVFTLTLSRAHVSAVPVLARAEGRGARV